MNKNIFVFDTNKCVACEACIMACIIENKTDESIKWRNINTYNNLKHPELPLFNFSIACNNCDNPLCLKNCPTKAYSYDKKTGVIIHDEKKCIGCQYCTWVCPYDVPVYSEKYKIVQKCNFCNNKLKKGLPPACTNSCPTGALSFEKNNVEIDYKTINEFPDYELKPSLKLLAINREDEMPEIAKQVYSVSNTYLTYTKYQKIKLKKEWPLAVFTFLFAILSSVLFSKSKIDINPHIYTSVAIFNILFATIHLGVKQKAYRAILNVRHSWLSREILLYIIYIILSVTYLYFYQNKYLFNVIFGVIILCSLSIDYVYSVTKSINKLNIHSSSILLTVVFLTALFTQNIIFVIGFGIIKSILYIHRKIYFNKEYINYRFIISVFRLGFLISIPAILYFINFEYFYIYIIVSIILGEIIDRLEFYDELKTEILHNRLEDNMLNKYYEEYYIF